MDVSQLMALRTQIIDQNTALSRAAGRGAAEQTDGGVTGFGDALRDAVKQVNTMQATAASVSEAYERGETTDIASVMLARQQASIGFEATLQVRNKLLSAYRDIMSMSV